MELIKVSLWRHSIKKAQRNLFILITNSFDSSWSSINYLTNFSATQIMFVICQFCCEPNRWDEKILNKQTYKQVHTLLIQWQVRRFSNDGQIIQSNDIEVLLKRCQHLTRLVTHTQTTEIRKKNNPDPKKAFWSEKKTINRKVKQIPTL